MRDIVRGRGLFLLHTICLHQVLGRSPRLLPSPTLHPGRKVLSLVRHLLFLSLILPGLRPILSAHRLLLPGLRPHPLALTVLSLCRHLSLRSFLLSFLCSFLILLLVPHHSWPLQAQALLLTSNTMLAPLVHLLLLPLAWVELLPWTLCRHCKALLIPSS